MRLGHKTATVKCYSTELTKQSTVCAHCEQLWALADDDGFYEVTEDMKDAWARYQKGERKAMKNWSSMRGMQDYFEKEVQIVKDLLQDSEFAVPADWPHMGWVAAQKTFMQQAGVLFADAGRSRNPYQRTAQEQAAIAAYARSMLRMWLRVGATVSKDKWIIHLKELQRKAQLIARAAKWAVQRQYPLLQDRS